MTQRLCVFLGLALLAPSVASATSLRGKLAVKPLAAPKAEATGKDWRVRSGTETPAVEAAAAPVVVVFIEGVRVATVVPPAEAAEIKTQGFKVKPATLPMVAGQELQFTNADGLPVTPVLSGKPKKRLEPDEKLQEHLANPGTFKLTTREWASLKGTVLVLPTRYFTVVGADGSVAIDEIPPGTYTVKVFVGDDWAFEKKDVTFPERGGVMVKLPQSPAACGM